MPKVKILNPNSKLLYLVNYELVKQVNYTIAIIDLQSWDKPKLEDMKRSIIPDQKSGLRGNVIEH